MYTSLVCLTPEAAVEKYVPITPPAAPMLESVKGIVLGCVRIVGVGMAAFVEPLFFSWKYRIKATMSPIKSQSRARQ
jgi:hypothetical protein